MSAAAQPLLLEQHDSRLEQLTTPEVKEAVVDEFYNVYHQFCELQKTPAVLPVSKEDLFYSGEEDWLYQKDGSTDTRVLQRFQTAGSHIVNALNAHKAATTSALPPPKRADAPKPAARSGPLQVARWVVKNALVPGLMLFVGTRLWCNAPRYVLDLPGIVRDHLDEREQRVPLQKVDALLDEVLEMTQSRPERYHLVEEWLDSDGALSPLQWLQQKEQQQEQQLEQQVGN